MLTLCVGECVLTKVKSSQRMCFWPQSNSISPHSRRALSFSLMPFTRGTKNSNREGGLVQRMKNSNRCVPSSSSLHRLHPPPHCVHRCHYHRSPSPWKKKPSNRDASSRPPCCVMDFGDDFIWLVHRRAQLWSLSLGSASYFYCVWIYVENWRVGY